jgi:hypothetical protein
MMSLPEQGAKVATSVVDAMRGQPMMLAVIVLNMLMLFIIVFAIYYGVRQTRETEAALIGKLIEQNSKALELMSKCVVPHNINLIAETIPT